MFRPQPTAFRKNQVGKILALRLAVPLPAVACDNSLPQNLLGHGDRGMMTLELNPLIAAGVLASTAATDAVYVMFNAAVMARHPARAANWSSLWYVLSAFAVISYTGNPVYVLFAASGSWVGAYCSVLWLRKRGPTPAQATVELRPSSSGGPLNS